MGRKESKKTNKQINEINEANDRYVFQKNKLMIEQTLRYKTKRLKQLALNDEEYKRKTGRMKRVTFTYEWEKDAEQEKLDEMLLNHTYQDTKMGIKEELAKIKVTLDKVEQQNGVIVEKYPHFQAEVKGVEDFTDEELGILDTQLNESRGVNSE